MDQRPKSLGKRGSESRARTTDNDEKNNAKRQTTSGNHPVPSPKPHVTDATQVISPNNDTQDCAPTTPAISELIAPPSIPRQTFSSIVETVMAEAKKQVIDRLTNYGWIEVLTPCGKFQTKEQCVEAFITALDQCYGFLSCLQKQGRVSNEYMEIINGLFSTNPKRNNKSWLLTLAPKAIRDHWGFKIEPTRSENQESYIELWFRFHTPKKNDMIPAINLPPVDVKAVNITGVGYGRIEETGEADKSSKEYFNKVTGNKFHLRIGSNVDGLVKNRKFDDELQYMHHICFRQMFMWRVTMLRKLLYVPHVFTEIKKIIMEELTLTATNYMHTTNALNALIMEGNTNREPKPNPWTIINDVLFYMDETQKPPKKYPIEMQELKNDQPWLDAVISSGTKTQTVREIIERKFFKMMSSTPFSHLEDKQEDDVEDSENDFDIDSVSTENDPSTSSSSTSNSSSFVKLTKDQRKQQIELYHEKLLSDPNADFRETCMTLKRKVFSSKTGQITDPFPNHSKHNDLLKSNPFGSSNLIQAVLETNQQPKIDETTRQPVKDDNGEIVYESSVVYNVPKVYTFDKNGYRVVVPIPPPLAESDCVGKSEAEIATLKEKARDSVFGRGSSIEPVIYPNIVHTRTAANAGSKLTFGSITLLQKRFEKPTKKSHVRYCAFIDSDETEDGGISNGSYPRSQGGLVDDDVDTISI